MQVRMRKFIKMILIMVILTVSICPGTALMASAEEPDAGSEMAALQEEAIPVRGVSVRKLTGYVEEAATETELRAVIDMYSYDGCLDSDINIVLTGDIVITSGLDLIGKAGQGIHTIRIDGAGHTISFGSGVYGIFMNRVNLWIGNTNVTGYTGKYAPFQVTEDATLTLDQDTVISANHGGLAGAVLVAGKNAKVDIKNGTQIMNNASAKNGGAITSLAFWMARYTSSTNYEAHIGSPVVHITDSSLTENRADAGGAIYFSAGSLILENAQIFDNIATSAGGAVMIDRTDGVGEYSLKASDKALVRSLYKSPLMQVKSGAIISGNEAAYGGGIYLSGEHEITSADGSELTIESNHATQAGGGMFVSARGENRIYGTAFSNNYADGYGDDLFVNGFVSAAGNPNSYNGFLIRGLEMYESNDYDSLEPGEGMPVGENVYLRRATYEYGAASDITGETFRSYMSAKDSAGRYFISFCLEKSKHGPEDVPALANSAEQCLSNVQSKAVKALVMSWCNDPDHPERLSAARYGITDKTILQNMIPDLLALQHSVWVITESSASTTGELLNEVLNASGSEPYYKSFSVATLESQISKWDAGPAWISAITADLSVTETSSKIELSEKDFTAGTKRIDKVFSLTSDPISTLAGKTDIIVGNAAELSWEGLSVTLHAKDAEHAHDYIRLVGEAPEDISKGKWLKSIKDFGVELQATDSVPDENDIFKNMRELENGACQNTAVLGDPLSNTTYFYIPMSVTIPERVYASYAPTATKLLDNEVCTMDRAFSFVLSETDEYWTETETKYTSVNDVDGKITFPEIDISEPDTGAPMIDYYRYFVMYEEEDPDRADDYFYDKNVFLITLHITGDEMEETVTQSIRKGDGSKAQSIIDAETGKAKKNYTKCTAGSVKTEDIEFKNVTKEYFSLTVAKEWTSSEGGMIAAPTARIKVGLYEVNATGDLSTARDEDGKNIVAEITQTAGWQHTFTGLLRRDAKGELINYAVRELDSRNLMVNAGTKFALSTLTGVASDATSVFQTDYEDLETPATGNITEAKVINEMQMNPTLTKKVLDVREHEENTWEDSNTAAIGETVRFSLESFVPDTSAFAKENSFLMRFVDVLPAGFDYKKIETVRIGGFEVDPSEITVQEQAGTNTTRLSFIISSLYKDMENAICKTGDSISIEYSATLNQLATVGLNGNTNTGWLEYSDKNAKNQITSTAKDATKTYIGMFTIEKKDRESLEFLENVGFSLSGRGLTKVHVGIPDYDEEGNLLGYTPKEIKVIVKDGMGKTEEVFTDKNGSIVFYGLGSGDYILTETTYLYDYKKISPVNLNFRCAEKNDFGDMDANAIAAEKCSWLLNDKTDLVETVYNSTQNYRGNICVTKLDAETGLAIPGVTFTLAAADGSEIIKSTDENGKEIKVKALSLKTGDDGKLRYTDLTPGKYVLTETRAANGKSLLKDPISITIPYEATIREVEDKKDIDLSNAYFDEEKGVYLLYDLNYTVTDTARFDLPATGGYGSLPWVIGSIVVLAALGAGYLILRMRSSRRSFAKR